MSLTGLSDSWRFSVGTLTAIPVRPPAQLDRQVAGRGMLLAPAAALPLGAAVTVIGLLGHQLGVPSLALGALAVAATALGTRALHWDGLSDTVDGLAASYDRERALTVMRSGAAGPTGVLAIVLVAGLQIAGFAALLSTVDGAITAGAAVCLARCALPTACVTFVPSARPEGLGNTVAGTVHPLAAAAWWVVTAVVAALLVGPWGVAASAVALLVVIALLTHVICRLGGVTGDVLGAGVELATAALLVGLATV